MSADATMNTVAAKGKGPPPKGLGKGAPPAMGKGVGKGPPMMPGGGPQRPGSREATGPKLRPLFWTAVNQVPPESVWADLVQPAPFDKAELERQFALAESRAPTAAKAGGAGSREGSQEPRKRVRVLDDRTSQMLAIAFNRLPPPERVAEMVDSLEDFPDGLTSEAVLALHGALSEHQDAVEQIRLVAGNPEAIAQLDMPERFLLRLSSVPFCLPKLSSGALMVGSSKDLTDLRLAGQKVGVCCQEIRKSGLLTKCISTSLAVGNCLNRGTARSGVRGVVLPDSLLKLEELRGASIDGSEKEKSIGSVLDFVAQALMNEEGVNEDNLRKEADSLLAKARAASSVSLEETESNCRSVNEEATKVRQGLNEVPASPGMANMIGRVDRICEEATLAVKIAQQAKEQLAKAQLWSCCKGKVKSDTWFASWVQFLELLPRALARAQEAKAVRLAQEAEDEVARKALAARQAEEDAKGAGFSTGRSPLSEFNFPAPLAEDPAQKRFRDMKALVHTALAPKKSPAKEPTEDAEMSAAWADAKEKSVPTKRSSKAKASAFDEEARIDNIDWNKLNQMHALNQQDPIKQRSEAMADGSFNNKENSAY